MGSNLSVIETATNQPSSMMAAQPTRLCTFANRLALIGVSALLLNFSFSPHNQFYLAFVGLVPVLMVLRSLRHAAAGFFWGWLSGVCFFAATLTWIWHTTYAGTFVLIIYCALWWGLAGAIIVYTRLIERMSKSVVSAIIASLAIAAVWVTQEWIRVTLFTGFPWIPLGQSQTPFLSICQIADITGVFGVSFLILLVNACVFVWIVRPQLSVRIGVTGTTATVLLLTMIYGSVMLAKPLVSRGPRVMVVQPNFPHERGGKRIVTFPQLEQFHFEITNKALANDRADLIVWSETALPPMNIEARRQTRDKHLAVEIHDNLLSLVRANHTSLVFGAYALVKFTGNATEADIRNSTYFYSHQQNDQPRYDKIHLVPFGEIVPFKHSWPWAYRMFMKFAAFSVEYTISPGSVDHLTVFEIETASGRWKFCTPICFEDTDGALIASMIRPTDGQSKRADFLVNISNDGWFNERQKWQHIQSAAFRSIENRVSTARSCNTGMSGFIDPFGKVVSMMPPNIDGVQFADMPILADGSLTFYTRFGNLFAYVCSGVSAILVVVEFIRRRRKTA